MDDLCALKDGFDCARGGHCMRPEPVEQPGCPFGFVRRATKWEPIETAPKHLYVLVSRIDADIYTSLPRAGILRVGNDGYGWCDTEGNLMRPQPTHWDHLPPVEVE